MRHWRGYIKYEKYTVATMHTYMLWSLWLGYTLFVYLYTKATIYGYQITIKCIMFTSNDIGFKNILYLYSVYASGILCQKRLLKSVNYYVTAEVPDRYLYSDQMKTINN